MDDTTTEHNRTVFDIRGSFISCGFCGQSMTEFTMTVRCIPRPIDEAASTVDFDRVLASELAVRPCGHAFDVDTGEWAAPAPEGG